MSDSCKTCLHRRDVVQPGAIVPMDICTRNPPMMIGTNQGIMGAQPPIPASLICGEFTGLTGKKLVELL